MLFDKVITKEERLDILTRISNIEGKIDSIRVRLFVLEELTDKELPEIECAAEQPVFFNFRSKTVEVISIERYEDRTIVGYVMNDSIKLESWEFHCDFDQHKKLVQEFRDEYSK